MKNNLFFPAVIGFSLLLTGATLAAAKSTFATADSLIAVQQASCAANAERPFMGVKRNGTYTYIKYKDFCAQVDLARGGLASLGVTKGDKVAIIANNRPEWAVASYATMGLGGAFVAMYEKERPEGWLYKLKDSAAKVVFVANDKIAEAVTAVKADLPALKHVIVLEAGKPLGMSYAQLITKGSKHPAKAVELKQDDLMGLIYTSGTTGSPKGVILTHGNLLAGIAGIIANFPEITAADSSLSFLPWAHVFGQLVEVHVLIAKGYSTALAESSETIVANLAEVRPTILFSVPTIFERLHKAVIEKMDKEGGLAKKLFDEGMRLSAKQRAGQRLNPIEAVKLAAADKLVFSKVRARFGGRLKYAVSGGAKLGTAVGAFIDSLKINVLEGYGMTESAGVISVNTLKDKKLGSVGKPLPNLKVSIDKAVTGCDKNACDEGEIIVHGGVVMKGYHNRPEDTKSTLTADGGLRTGDIGKLDKDGFLVITGRVKERYKLSNGLYVVPSEYEIALKASSYVSNAFLYGADHDFNVVLISVNMPRLETYAAGKNIPAKGQALLAHPEIQALFNAELAKIGAEFASYMRPQRFALLTDEWTTDNGMLTPTLKLIRKKAEERYADLIAKLYEGSK